MTHHYLIYVLLPTEIPFYLLFESSSETNKSSLIPVYVRHGSPKEKLEFPYEQLG